MVQRKFRQRIIPFATLTALMAGCLELTTTNQPNETGESSSSSSSSSNGMSTTSSSTSSTSSSSGTTSSSASSASSSSSSASSASSGTPVMHEIIAKSNFGTMLQNDSSAVVCGVDPQTLPNGMSGDAFECTHITDASGVFFQGLSVELTAGVPYVFSFFFRNGNFDSPFGQLPPPFGFRIISPNGGAGAPLHMFDPYSNNWYRQRFEFTAKITGTHQFGVMHTINRPPGGGYWLYGFQAETGTTVTDYVPE